MAMPTAMTDLTVDEATNVPADSETVTAALRPSDYLRAHAAIMRRPFARGADVASATAANLGSNTDGDYFHVTGTTGLSASNFGTVDAGVERTIVFDGALLLTHNATSFILPGGANITSAAGDVSTWRSEGSGNWKCTSYVKASGAPIGSYQPLDTTLTALAGALTAANKIPYATALNTLGELDFKDEDNMASNSATALPSQQSVKAYADAVLVAAAAAVTARFDDTGVQTITAAGTLTIAHSLGVVPKIAVCWLTCQTGEYGYTAGDKVIANLGTAADLTRDYGASVTCDASNIVIRYASTANTFLLPNKTTGAQVALTNANWKFSVEVMG